VKISVQNDTGTIQDTPNFPPIANRIGVQVTVLGHDKLFTMESLPALFPPEIWTMILKHDFLQRVDLKNVRLVCRALREIVTPMLFEEVCFSASFDTVISFSHLLTSQDLVQHVKTLVVDTTTYKKCDTKEDYAKLASSHFRDTLYLSGPAFECSNLMEMLDERPYIRIPGYHWTEGAGFSFHTGYIQYQAAAEFQALYLEHDCYSDLVHVIPQLKDLRRIKLSPDWHLPSSHLQQLRKVAWHPAFEEEIDNSESILDLITRQVAWHPLGIQGWVFTGPGPTARNMYPLHVPPTRSFPPAKPAPFLIQTAMPPDLCYDASIVGHLIQALSTCNTTLEQVSFSGLPIYSLARHATKYPFPSTNTMILSMDIFRSLKKLTLEMDHESSVDPADQSVFLDTHKIFSKFTQAMSNVEVLSIGFSGWPETSCEVPHDLFKLMLEDSSQHASHDRTIFTCHRDELSTTDVNDTRNLSVWCPSSEVPRYDLFKNPPANPQLALPLHESSSKLLRILPVSPWPRLINLTLNQIVATKFDLASMMIMVAPTLRALTLNQVTIRDCPCEFDERLHDDELVDVDEPSQLKSLQWYEVKIMLHNVLKLDACVIQGWYERVFVNEVSRRLEWTESEVTDVINSVDNFLGRYVLESEGESPALWLRKMKTPAI